MGVTRGGVPATCTSWGVEDSCPPGAAPGPSEAGSIWLEGQPPGPQGGLTPEQGRQLCRDAHSVA